MLPWVNRISFHLRSEVTNLKFQKIICVIEVVVTLFNTIRNQVLKSRNKTYSSLRQGPFQRR